MEFARQREDNEKLRKKDEFIVKTNKNKLRYVLSLIMTFFMWIYTLTIIFVFESGIFNTHEKIISLIKNYIDVSNGEIKLVVFMGVIYFFSTMILLVLWKVYNKTMYKIRKNRKNRLKGLDILSLDLIDSETYEMLHDNKIIKLQKNPIKDF